MGVGESVSLTWRLREMGRVDGAQEESESVDGERVALSLMRGVVSLEVDGFGVMLRRGHSSTNCRVRENLMGGQGFLWTS